MARRITVTRVVPASPDAVWGIVGDLARHWALGGRFLAARHLEDEGQRGEVELNGPLGIHRRVHIELVETDPVRQLTGRAMLPSGTWGEVRWTLRRAEPGTLVGLALDVHPVGPVDSLLVLVGGWWLRRRLADLLDRLSSEFTAG